MGMVIHDDYYEAAMQLPAKQRGDFLMAVVRYGFEGAEPQGSPPWLPVFTVIKGRIALSAERAKAGSKGGAKRKQKRSKSMNCSNAGAEQSAGLPTRVEDEDEDEDEKPPSSPFEQIGEDAPFWLQCLAAFTEVTGHAYTTMPERCRHMLERSEGACTVDEVKEMVAYKRDEWAGTRWKGCITPNFLFSPDHFEQCMNQSKAAREEAGRHGVYDRDDAPFA